MSGLAADDHSAHCACIHDANTLRLALAGAIRLLDNARCDLGDPSLKRRWAQERKRLRRVESDTSSNARPDTADDGTYWPESAAE